MSLVVKEVRSFEELAELAPRWSELLPNSGEDDVFLRPEWMMSWWKVWGDRHKLCTLSVLMDGEVVGIAPLILTPRGKVKRWTKLQFLATGPSDHLGVISKNGDPEVLGAIWRYVQGMQDWDVLELRELWEYAPTFASFKRAFRDFEMNKGVSLYVDLSIGEEKFYKSLPGVVKHERRYWHKMRKDLDVEFREFTATQDLALRLEELKYVNLKRWEGEGTSPFAHPRMERFLSMVAVECAESLGSTFKGLYSGDRAIACSLGFVHGRRYLYYIPGYDSDFSKYSPGSVLRGKILEECLSNGFAELDLLRGSEKHKFQYNAKDRGLISVRVIRSGVIRGVEARLREGDFL